MTFRKQFTIDTLAAHSYEILEITKNDIPDINTRDYVAVANTVREYVSNLADASPYVIVRCFRAEGQNGIIVRVINTSDNNLTGVKVNVVVM